MARSYFVFLLIGVVFLLGCSNSNSIRQKPDAIIKTNIGIIEVILYDDTPNHRDNFLKLAREGYYDSLMFHRIIYNFMVQVGDPRTRNAQAMEDTTLGDGPGYELDPEISEKYIHTSGKLAAARYPDHINPDWKSSGSQFYIITGKPVSPGRLDSMELQYDYVRKDKLFAQYQVEVNNKTFDKSFNEYLDAKGFKEFKYSKEQREAYYKEGGAPWLDFQYTIFGELVSGYSVAQKISEVPLDMNNRPRQAIRILSIEIVEPEPESN